MYVDSYIVICEIGAVVAMIVW